jgi:hypothetical protein
MPMAAPRGFVSSAVGWVGPSWRMGQAGTLLKCVECGAESDQLASGWQAYAANKLDEDEPETEVLMFCPECAEREFRSLGWDPS